MSYNGGLFGGGVFFFGHISSFFVCIYFSIFSESYIRYISHLNLMIFYHILHRTASCKN
ncbi:hypothetical protein GGS20DRAFT_534879, partial [Poronia punctata]